MPEVASLELTYRCNHQCIFCSCPWEDDSTYKQEELSADEWKEVIKALIAHGVSSFTLTGGEPSLRPDLREIIEFILEQNMHITIISNGRRIDDSFLDYISGKNISMCISIPGIETFVEHTGIDNVDHVLSLYGKTRARGIHTTANIAVTKKNLPELYENIAYALINGAEYILINRFMPGGRGLSNQKFLLSLDETNEMLDIAEEVLSKAKKYGHVGTELPLCAIKHPEKYKYLQVSNRCSASKGFCVVDPSGYIKVCNHSPTKVCRYDELDKLTDNSYWKRFRSRDYLPEMCKNCGKNDICDGGCREAAHVYHGKVNDPDPIFDEITLAD